MGSANARSRTTVISATLRKTLRVPIARTSMALLCVNLGATLFTLGLHLLLARLFGQAAYSGYAYALTWITVLTLLPLMGSETTIQRFVPLYVSQKDWGRLRGFLLRSFQIITISSALIILLGLFILEGLENRIDTLTKRTFQIALIALGPSVLILAVGALLRGLHSPLLATVPRLGVRPLILSLAIFLVWATGMFPFTSATAMGLELLATLVAVGVGAALVRRRLPGPTKYQTDTRPTSEWFSEALPHLAGGFLQLLIRNIDTLMLGLILGSESGGTYSLASRIAQLAAFGLIAVNGALPALISRHHAKSEMRELRDTVRWGARIAFGVSIISATLLIGLRQQVLNYFGSGFDSGATALAILSLGQVANAFTGSAGFVLAMTGHQKTLVRTLSKASAATIILCAILIPSLGMTGAATATSITIIGSNIALARACRRVLGIDPTILGISPKNVSV